MRTQFIKKITHGYVTQYFDLVSGQFVAQDFTAGDFLVEWENEDGSVLEGEDRTEADKLYVPFTMEQPRGDCELYVAWHSHGEGGTAYLFWANVEQGHTFDIKTLAEALNIDFEPEKQEFIDVDVAGSRRDLTEVKVTKSLSEIEDVEWERAMTPTPKTEYYTYDDLLAAIQELSPEQRKMTATVSAGCDTNGDAEFFPVSECLLAGDSQISAAAEDVFDNEAQPVIMFGASPEDEVRKTKDDTEVTNN